MKRTLILLFVGAILTFLSSNVQAQQSKKITLAGYKHNPPVSTSGSGTATVTLHGDTLTVEGEFENLVASYSGGYIMVNLRGEGGNQLYRLKANIEEEDRTRGTFTTKENKFVLSSAEKELLKSGDLYLNISSHDNKKGELRGDIGSLGG